MSRTTLISIVTLVMLLAAPALADRRAAQLARKLADDAAHLSRSADRSSDRRIRRAFAAGAAELADDLARLASRTRKDAPYARLAKDAGELSRDADELAELADEAEHRRERRRLRDRAAQLEDRIADLQRDLEDLAEENRQRRDRREPAKPQPISNGAFAALVKALDAESFEDGKLSVVRSAVQGNHFLAGQIAIVMDQFSFSSGKVESAALMWTRVLDPQNSFVIY